MSPLICAAWHSLSRSVAIRVALSSMLDILYAQSSLSPQPFLYDSYQTCDEIADVGKTYLMRWVTQPTLCVDSQPVFTTATAAVQHYDDFAVLILIRTTRDTDHIHSGNSVSLPGVTAGRRNGAGGFLQAQ